MHALVLLLTLSAGHKMAVEYGPAKPAHAALRQKEQQRGVLEAFAKIAVTVRLPRDITLALRECDAPTAFWDRASATIVLCYGYYDFVRSVVGEKQQLPVIAFTLLHELGHALAHDLELPIVGRGEDAADRYATVFALSVESEIGDQIIAAAARFFLELSKRHQPSFWDEHSSEGTRFYDLACAFYGGRPSTYSRYFSDGVLPAARAVRCAGEFQQALRGWNALLEPYSNIEGGKTF